jgi:hypothetical protein
MGRKFSKQSEFIQDGRVVFDSTQVTSSSYVSHTLTAAFNVVEII